MKKFCENDGCETPAYRVVRVSVRKYGDQKRSFCYPCSEAYTIGVQHGDKRHTETTKGES